MRSATRARRTSKSSSNIPRANCAFLSAITGCGIDPQVLQSGREGHLGLSGMRERAERIGARLRVWSRTEAGTEVELSVPGHVAFQFPSSDPMRSWIARLYPRKAGAVAQSQERRDIE